MRLAGKIIIFSVGVLFLFNQSLPGEKISFRISYNTVSFPESDIDSWISSYNQMWKDWAAQKGGSTSGEFSPLNYSPTIELGINIPIFSGLSLCLSGSKFSSQAEGQVFYSNQAQTQEEKHSIENKISGYPFKIGFQYSYILPFQEKIGVLAGIGRHLIFIKYQTKEDYEARFDVLGKEFVYWFEKENTYNSEALGFYFNGGVEYSPIKYITFIAGFEQVWNKIDGFKGPFSYKDYSGEEESGKASLYYFESNQWGLNQYYQVLDGRESRPEESTIRNVRQGQFDFSGFSFKIGFRLNF